MEIIRWADVEVIGTDYYISGLERAQEGTSQISGGSLVSYYPAPGAGTQEIAIPASAFTQVSPGVFAGSTNVDVLITAGYWGAATCCTYAVAGSQISRSNIVPILDWRPM
jgi:hypothetical protein